MAYLTNVVKNAEGTNIYIEDSYKLKDFDLKGNTEQETTTGKNIFKPNAIATTTKNGITASYDRVEQVFTFNGTCMADNTTFTLGNNEIEFVSGTTKSTTYWVDGSVSTYCQMRHFNADYTISCSYLITTLSSSVPNLSKTTTSTFTCPSSQTTIRFNNGSVANNFKIKIMVANTENTDYEEYTNGISPNPEFPQSVETVSGRQDIIVSGKNLLKNSLNVVKFCNTLGTWNDNVYTLNNLTFTYNEDGSIKVNGTANALTQFFINKSGYNFTTTTLPSGSNYYLSIHNTSTGNSTFKMQFSISGITYNVYGNGTYKEPQVTATEEKIVNNAYIAVYSGQTVNNQVFYPMIATTSGEDYEAFKGNDYEINLGKNILNLTDGTYSAVGIDAVVSGGTITLNGTATANSFINIPITPILMKAGVSYMFSANNKQTVGGDASSSFACMRLRTSSADVSSSDTLFNVIDSYKQLNYGQDYDFRYLRIRTASGLSYDNFIIYPQLELGVVKTNYSAYKEPIELCKLGNYQDFIRKGKGKNIFNNEIVKKNQGNYTVITDTTLSTGKKLTYTSTTTTTDTRFVAYAVMDLTDYVGKTIRMKANFKASSSNTGRYLMGLCNSDGSNRTVKTTIADVSGTTIEFTVPELSGSQKYLLVNLYVNGYNGTVVQNDYVDYTDVIITISNGDLTYEPYGFDNKWYIYKAIGKTILNGTETWAAQWASDNRYGYRTTINNIYKASNANTKGYLKSNYYIDYTQNEVFALTTGSGTGISLRTNQSEIIIRNDAYTTVADFKTWLGSNNTIVYYVLATPTATEITDGELLQQLEAVKLIEGQNNVSISSSNLSSFLDIDYYSTENPYLDVIYSQGETNDLKIWFNDVELQDASRYCEKITRTARILPDDGSSRFSLDNFISTSLQVILHNVDLEDIKDQVKISIGTLVENDYVYIPLGIFNIQDVPEKDGNTVTLKLRDNRVKFDFNYNAKPLFDENVGVASKKQILQDICQQAGVENGIQFFNGENDIVGIYDSTIQATTYVSYLMEQAGLIPAIDRNGKLIAIDLSNIDKWRIPLSVVESYEKGEPYSIRRVVYESGVIKYETSDDESLDTLYINSANPYVSNDSQVSYILNKLSEFNIDSVTTKRVLGNPAIDPYDLIEIYNDLDNTNDVVFKTLANTEYVYNGVHRNTFDTKIGKEERTENVSKNSDANYRKTAKTEIDSINANITLLATTTEQYQQESNERINGLTERTNTVEQTLTSTQATIEVMEQEIIDGQQSLRNNLVTIDINGINVSTNTSAISTLITNDNFVIMSGTTPLAYFGYDETEGISKSQMDNLTVTNFFVAGNHRIEEYSTNRTGVFYIGG